VIVGVAFLHKGLLTIHHAQVLLLQTVLVRSYAKANHACDPQDMLVRDVAVKCFLFKRGQNNKSHGNNQNYLYKNIYLII
jgi:hypothetical protein